MPARSKSTCIMDWMDGWSRTKREIRVNGREDGRPELRAGIHIIAHGAERGMSSREFWRKKITRSFLQQLRLLLIRLHCCLFRLTGLTPPFCLRHLSSRTRRRRRTAHALILSRVSLTKRILVWRYQVDQQGRPTFSRELPPETLQTQAAYG